MPTNAGENEDPKPLLPFVAYLAAFFGGWTAWVLYIYPEMIKLGVGTIAYAAVNISFRLVFWILPVFLYLRFVDGVDPIRFLKLKDQWKLGVTVGLVFFLLNFLLSLIAYGIPNPDPAAFTWNSVLGTSFFIGFVEEIPFRGFILQKFQERMNFWIANLFSSVLFLFIHFPGWISLNLFNTRIVIFVSVFGFVMAILLWYTRSLWSPIIAHSSNEFLALLIF